MPRRAYPLVSDNYYHIFNRGVNRQPIFNEKPNYIRAVNLIRYYKVIEYPVRFSKFLLLSNDQRKSIWNRLTNEKSYVDIVAYCLIPNHFHLLLKQNIDNGISKFLGNFQNSYVRYFNRKYDRIGPLFQGPFKSVKVDTEEQLLHLSRYIHLNPYSSAIINSINDIEKYTWSSFHEYLNIAKFQFCLKDVILNSFKDNKGYKTFVLNNAEYQRELNRIEHLTID